MQFTVYLSLLFCALYLFSAQSPGACVGARSFSTLERGEREGGFSRNRTTTRPPTGGQTTTRPPSGGQTTTRRPGEDSDQRSGLDDSGTRNRTRQPTEPVRIRDEARNLTAQERAENERTKIRDSRANNTAVEMKRKGSEMRMDGTPNPQERRRAAYVRTFLRRISDSDGQFLDDLDAVDFQWTGPVNITTPAVGVKYSVNKTFTLPNNANPLTVKLEVMMFPSVAEVPYGNTTRVKVGKGNIKWSLDVMNWPWNATSDPATQSLRVRFQLRSTGSTVEANASDANIGKIRFGDSVADFPLYAIVDGTEKSIDVQYEYEVDDGAAEDGGSETVSNVLFIFPRFQSTLHYDPVVGVAPLAEQPTTTTTAKPNNSAMGRLATLLAFVLGALAVLVFL